MTVFYILDSFPSLSENFILREITALRKLGLDVKVCSLKRSEEGTVHPDALQLVKDVVYVDDLPIMGKFIAVARNICGHPAYCGLLMLSLFHDMFISFRFMLQRLRGAFNAMAIADLAGARPDHVHAHFAYVTADVAGVLSGISNCRWSVSAHAWDIFTQPGKITTRRLEGADRIFVCSRHGMEVLESLSAGDKTAGKIVLMYHGVDNGEFEAKGRLGHVIAVGRLEEKKGFDVLIQACGILAGQGLRPRCIIVGDGPQLKLLESEIRRLGLDNIELPGALPFEKVKTLMAESNMLVHPGRKTANGDRDGIPNVILEAMALGKPVIASSVGGIPELVEDGVNGLLVSPEDPVRLAAMMKKIQEDEVLAERIGRSAKEHVVKHFEISETIKPLFKYFSACGAGK